MEGLLAKVCIEEADNNADSSLPLAIVPSTMPMLLDRENDDDDDDDEGDLAFWRESAGVRTPKKGKSSKKDVLIFGKLLQNYYEAFLVELGPE